MDEAYASPSSDGHATLPSPTDSTFDLSLLPPPRKRRNRTTEPHPPTSSFVNHAPTEHDSSDGEGDETFLRGTLAWDGCQRMLPSSPALPQAAAEPPPPPQNSAAGSGSSKASPQRLMLREKENFGARGGNGSRRASPPPRLTLGDRGKENSGASPRRDPPLLLKPQGEDGAAGGNGASTTAGEVSYAGAVVDESIVRPAAAAAAAAAAPGSGTSTAMIAAKPTGNAYGQNNDTKPRSTTPPGNTPRRSLVAHGQGIEPQYPIAGDVYGRRRVVPEDQSAAPSGDAPRQSLGSTSHEPTATGGAYGQTNAPEPRSTAPPGDASQEGLDSSSSDPKPQPATGDTDRQKKDPEPRPTRNGSTTPPADAAGASKAPELLSTTPPGDPPMPSTDSPEPLPQSTAPTCARSLDTAHHGEGSGPSTPANNPPSPSKKLGPIPNLRRRSTSPAKPTPAPPSPPKSKPASPESFLGKTPRYLNWLNSSMDEGHTEPPAVPTGHEARLREALAQRIPDESEFMGGDEASFVDREEEDDDDDDGGEMLGGPGRSAERSFFDDDGEVDPEESRLTAMSEAELPALPGASEGDVSGSAASGVDIYDGASDDRPEEKGARKRRKKDKGKAQDAQNTVYHSIMEDESAAAAAAAAGESDSGSGSQRYSPSPQSSPAKKVGSTDQEPPSEKAKSPPAIDPTMPQFFSDAPPEPSTRAINPSNAPPSSDVTTVRPSIAEVYKVAKPRSTTLIGKKSFNELLTAKSSSSPTNLADLKKSSRARRVSMTTPPSSALEDQRSPSGTDFFLGNPPDFSSLGSGFSFASVPVRYKEGPERRDFAPLERRGAKVRGSTESTGSSETVVGKERRPRSRSEPNEIRAWMESKGLVVPMRVGETKEMQDRRSGSEEERGSRRNEEQEEEEEEEEEEDLGYSEDESENDGGRHWSGLAQGLGRGGGAKDKEPAAPRAAEKGEAPADPANLNNVEFRVHTPASVGESKDVISDLEGSSKTLWVRMAQAEAENNHFRKLLESNNIKIEDSYHDLSESNLDVRFQDSRDDDFNVSTSEDVGSLRRRVMELEGLLEIVARKEMELRAENERKDNLVMHWRNQYNDVQKLALQNRQRALGLESHVKTLEQQAAADFVNHDREINKVVSKLTEKHDVIKHSRQKSLGLEDRLAAVEGQVRDAQEALDEKERTITQLRQALERRRAFSGEGSSEDLQEKLFEQQQAHEADTAKFGLLLEEKEGLVRHLQAELDEMVNLMPVDHGSSRMIDEEEVEDWLDEKSREISQYYDDGLDQIITELQGTGEREDFEEAVEEAEMSLRKVAEQAGLDEPLDKATLAAFGIRQLRAEHARVKRLLAESEAKVKDAAELNEKLARRGDLGEKLRVSEEQRAAFQTVAKEAEAAGKVLADQLDALREKMAKAEQHMRSLEAENEAVETKLSDVEEKASSLEGEKEALRVLVKDTKRLNEMLKSQSAESEQRRHASEEEIAGLRRQLAEEKAHVSVIETETITLRQQIARWEDAAAAASQEKEGAQAQLKEALARHRALEREKDALRRQLDDAARAQVASREADSLRRVVKELQERLKALNEQHAACALAIGGLEGRARHAEQAAQRTAAEKDALKAELEAAADETKAARGRFAQLLHDTAEKEARRLSRGGSFAATTTGENSEACRRALHVIATEIERCALPAHIDLPSSSQSEQIFVAEGVQDPELVRAIIGAFRLRDRVIAEMDERGRRYKGAAKKYLKDAERRKGRVEELAAEVRELGVRLKAERRSSDEKMGQMILALRKGGGE